MKSNLKPALLCTLLLLFSACYTTRAKSLYEIVTEYNDAIRWHHYPTISLYSTPACASSTIATLDATRKHFRITDVEVLSIKLLPTQTRAEVLVRVSWYDPADMKAKSGLEVQIWKKSGQKWVMQGRRAPLKNSVEPSFLVHSTSNQNSN